MRTWFLPLLGIALLHACKREPIRDPDAELFRTPEQLTTARQLNIAKWTGDFVQRNGKMPDSLAMLRPIAEVGDPKEEVLNDAWGRPMQLQTFGEGFQVWSAGADGRASTSDDIVHQVGSFADVK